jgi:hypothetical protein
MGRAAGLAGDQFTWLSWFGAAGGALNGESLVFLGVHTRILHRRKGMR